MRVVISTTREPVWPTWLLLIFVLTMIVYVSINLMRLGPIDLPTAIVKCTDGNLTYNGNALILNNATVKCIAGQGL